jgi:hypothetical protein
MPVVVVVRVALMATAVMAVPRQHRVLARVVVVVVVVPMAALRRLMSAAMGATIT